LLWWRERKKMAAASTESTLTLLALPEVSRLLACAPSNFSRR